MPYLYVRIDTGYVGAEHKEWIPLPDDWDTMDSGACDRFRQECEQEVLNNHVEVNSWIVEEEGDAPEEDADE